MTMLIVYKFGDINFSTHPINFVQLLICNDFLKVISKYQVVSYNIKNDSNFYRR